MAATGYTPISLYYSTTASAVPTSGNLANGELAINITDGKLYYKNNSGTVTLLATAGTTSSQWTTSGSDIYYNTGNVGIGRIPVAYSSFKVLDVAGASGAIQKWVHTGSTVELQAYASSTLTAVGSATNHPLLFVTNDTERMRLDTSGNLGIGATSPTQVFSIGGLGSTANTYKSMSFQSGSTEVNYVRAVVQDGNNYALSFGTYATGLAERMRITAAGNVGIGTSSPAEKLHISNGSSDCSVRVAGRSRNLYLGQDVNGALIYSDGAVSMNFYTNATEKARISSAGGFSVGTTADPGVGAIYATGNITAYYSSDIKFKENVRDIPDALATVNAIGGKLFDWTDEYIESKGGADGYFVQKADFGVVAQDVQKVFPIAVRTRDDGSLAVDYEKLGALAFAALVELTKRVEALEAK